jgi:tRNA(Ile)-lysidine synthase TilS/MesJ
MIPKLHSTNLPGMELIRPLSCVNEEDIVARARYNGLEFLRCACRFTENAAYDENASKRREIKLLIRRLRETNPDIEKSIFNSVHNVHIDTFPGIKTGGVRRSFLERYGRETGSPGEDEE